MANLAEVSKGELAQRLDRLRGRMATIKQEGKGIAKRTVAGALSAAGGYGVGYVRSRYGDPATGELNFPGTDIDADLVVGLGLTLLGVSGILDDQSDNACALGQGVLSGALALNAYKQGQADRAKGG